MNGVLGMMEVLEHQGLDEGQRRSVATMRDSALATIEVSKQAAATVVLTIQAFMAILP